MSAVGGGHLAIVVIETLVPLGTGVAPALSPIWVKRAFAVFLFITA